MITYQTILLILLIHWLADFCLQTDAQSKLKSTSDEYLFYHVATYSLVWFIASYAMLGHFGKAGIFTLVTMLCHYFTDYCTSRIGKPFWESKNYHDGFVVVGFDQTLHYVQLFGIYIWLSN